MAGARGAALIGAVFAWLSVGVHSVTAEKMARDAGASQEGQVAPGVRTPSDRTPWWRDAAIKKEIGLRDDQVRRIESLYAKRARDLDPLNKEFEKQRAELDRLMSDRAIGAAAIELQVARMEVPRARINESYFGMLYRMYLVLDPEQSKKLVAIFERQHVRVRPPI